MREDELDNACREEQCTIEGVHKAHVLIVKRGGRLPRQPGAGGPGRTPKACAACGAMVAKVRQKCPACGASARGNPAPRRAAAPAPAAEELTWPEGATPLDLPPPKREETTIGGTVYERLWTCPACEGRGWKTSDPTGPSCNACRGRAVLNEKQMRDYMEALR